VHFEIARRFLFCAEAGCSPHVCLVWLSPKWTVRWPCARVSGDASEPQPRIVHGALHNAPHDQKSVKKMRKSRLERLLPLVYEPPLCSYVRSGPKKNVIASGSIRRQTVGLTFGRCERTWLADEIREDRFITLLADEGTLLTYFSMTKNRPM